MPDGILPNDLIFYTEQWAELIKEINPRILSVTPVGDIEGFPVVKCEAGVPWPLSSRMLTQWRSSIIDRENQNHYFMLSSRGCEPLMQYTEEEKEKYAFATVHVGGFKFIPVKDESGAVIGTSLFNV